MQIRTLPLMLAAAGCALLALGLFAQQAPDSAPPDGPALAPPQGALPLKSGDGRGGLSYAPPSTSPAPGGVTANAYWSLAIQSDPADLKVYRQKNADLGPPKPGEDRVIFIGDSITENWQKTFNTNYPGKTNYIGRGYTSETTLQMLVRFRPDIVNLGAKVVVLMAGVNDIAGNTGAVPDETIHDNFISMFDLAKANDIKVVWVSTLPATRFFWQPGLQPTQRVKKLVDWEKEYAAAHAMYFVNAFDKFKDETDGMPRTYSSDTVHPNAQGYKILSDMVEVQIEKALKGEPPSP